MDFADAQDPLPKRRAPCLEHIGVVERLSHGEPAWFVRGRHFVTYADHHHDDRVAFWAAAPDGAQEALIESDPSRYFRPPYVGHLGWMGAWVDVPVDWDEMADRVREAFAAVEGGRIGRTTKAVGTVIRRRTHAGDRDEPSDPGVVRGLRHRDTRASARCVRWSIQALASLQIQMGPAASST